MYRSRFLPRFPGRLARHRRLLLGDPEPYGPTVSPYQGKVYTYSQPAFSEEVALMLWLIIKGARPPAVDATA
jgi:hypothetical protein